MSIEIEATPVTLKQRVLEAAEQHRKARLHMDALQLQGMLVKAGITQLPLDQLDMKLEYERVYCDLEGIRFSVSKYVTAPYDDEGEGVEILSLDANAKCPIAGCAMMATYGRAHGIKKLADLGELYKQLEQAADPRCSHCRNGVPLDDPKRVGDELSEPLPF